MISKFEVNLVSDLAKPMRKLVDQAAASPALRRVAETLLPALSAMDDVLAAAEENEQRDPEWAAFLDAHPELHGYEGRSRDGTPYYSWQSGSDAVYRFEISKTTILEGLERALRAKPGGVTAQETAVALWGQDEAGDSSALEVARLLKQLVRCGSVREIRGDRPYYKSSRWLRARTS